MSKFKCQECSHIFDVDRIPKIDRGSDAPTVNDYSGNFFWGPTDLGRAHQHSPADSGWAPAGTDNYDGVSSNVMMSSFGLFMRKQSSLNKKASLDDVLDQTTQDAIAAEYGVQYLIPLRLYSEATSYGQEQERAFRYAIEESKRMHQKIDPSKLAELIETYF